MLYVAFIDFRKPFDFISYSKLWRILQKTGIRGNMFQTIHSMYSIVTTRVRNGNMKCFFVTKQGEITSPFIFSLFINELATASINQASHGIQLILDNGRTVYFAFRWRYHSIV